MMSFVFGAEARVSACLVGACRGLTAAAGQGGGAPLHLSHGRRAAACLFRGEAYSCLNR